MQKSVEAIELRLAVERDLTGAEENGLRQWVWDKFSHPFQVSFSYYEEVPRTASGKYQDFVSEIG